MLELPEVETIRRDLEREVAGRRVKAVEVTGSRQLRHGSKKTFVERLTGAKIETVIRRGLLLTLRLDGGDLLVVDLGASGQLLRAQAKEPLDKAMSVVVTFTQGGQLRFRDEQGTAALWITSPDELLEQEPRLTRLGLDPIEEPVSWTQFGQLFYRHHDKLKAVLVDPTAIVGIGDLYADEILWSAGLRHDRISDALSTQEIRRLHRAVVETMHDAVKYSGTTTADGQYRTVHGKTGDYGDHLNVYERDKQACPRCRGTVSKVRFQQRPTYLCESCQV